MLILIKDLILETIHAAIQVAVAIPETTHNLMHHTQALAVDTLFIQRQGHMETDYLIAIIQTEEATTASHSQVAACLLWVMEIIRLGISLTQ